MTTEHDGHTITVGPVTTSPPTDEGSQPFTGHATLMATLATWRKVYDAQRSLGREHHPMTGTLAAAYDAYLAEPTTDRDWHTEIATVIASHLFGAPSPGPEDRRLAAKIVDALDLHGWPHTYQPDSPHVEAARQARAELAAAEAEAARRDAVVRLLWDATGIPADQEAEFVAGGIRQMVDTARITRTQLRPQLARAEADLAQARAERDKAVAELRLLRTGIRAAYDAAVAEPITTGVCRCGRATVTSERNGRIAALGALLADSPETALRTTETDENRPGVQHGTPEQSEPPQTRTWDGTTYLDLNENDDTPATTDTP